MFCRNLKPLLLLLSLVLISACVPLNSHQTGRTLGEHNYSFGGNYSLGKINSEQFFTIKENGTYHIAEVVGQFGISEKCDIGIKVNSTLHFTALGKYQILGNQSSKFASSVGLDAGIGPFGFVMGVISYSSALSSYNSYHINEKWAVTLSPRYLYLGFSNLLPQRKFTREFSSLGFSSGIVYGKKEQISLEYSWHNNTRELPINNKAQVSIGFNYVF